MPSSTDWFATYRGRSWPDSGSGPGKVPIIRRQMAEINEQIQ
jgi:hypothetical protein